jgi:acyl-CoA thioesterase-1
VFAVQWLRPARPGFHSTIPKWRNTANDFRIPDCNPGLPGKKTIAPAVEHSVAPRPFHASPRRNGRPSSPPTKPASMKPVSPHCRSSRLSIPLAALTVALSSLLTAAPPVAADKAPVDVEKFGRPVRLACVGDSITEGVGAKRGESWPDQLRQMLGDKWEVKNFGLSATTLMNSGNKPYQKCGRFTAALAYLPDVVVIMLGTNDTKPNNWKHFERDYEKDYRDMVADFAGLESKPRIFVCFPPYIAKDGNFGITEPNTLAQIPVIKRIAKALDLATIDVHGALDGKDALIPDKVHPNTEGATLIAEAVFEGLTGKPAPVPAGR